MKTRVQPSRQPECASRSALSTMRGCELTHTGSECCATLVPSRGRDCVIDSASGTITLIGSEESNMYPLAKCFGGSVQGDGFRYGYTGSNPSEPTVCTMVVNKEYSRATWSVERRMDT